MIRFNFHNPIQSREKRPAPIPEPSPQPVATTQRARPAAGVLAKVYEGRRSTNRLFSSREWMFILGGIYLILITAVAWVLPVHFHLQNARDLAADLQHEVRRLQDIESRAQSIRNQATYDQQRLNAIQSFTDRRVAWSQILTDLARASSPHLYFESLDYNTSSMTIQLRGYGANWLAVSNLLHTLQHQELFGNARLTNRVETANDLTQFAIEMCLRISADCQSPDNQLALEDEMMTCEDFSDSLEAEEYWLAHERPHALDPDGNGIPCEFLPSSPQGGGS